MAMRALLLLLALSCLFACSPKTVAPATETQITYYPLADTAFVLILGPEARFTSGEKITTITVDEIPDKVLQQKARTYGANLVKIISRYPKITAKLYFVKNVKQYEQKFPWSPDRKLTWDDYKGKPFPGQDDNVAARTTCRFGISIDTVNTVTVDVTSEFICQQSNVRPEQRKPALLAHEQLHFDLCEVYARMVRKELAQAQLTPANVKAISGAAFLRYYQLYKERQIIYDQETNHGLNIDAQAQWDKKVMTELTALAPYARSL